MTVADAAKLAGRTESTIQRWCASGKVKATRRWVTVDRWPKMKAMKGWEWYVASCHSTMVKQWNVNPASLRAYLRRIG